MSQPQDNCMVDDLLEDIDCILSVRDDVGLKKKDVFLLSRRWTGERIGDGQSNDSINQMKPTPQIVEFAHDVRITEVGAVKQGDIVLKNVSKQTYSKESEIDGSSQNEFVENFYQVGDHLYTVVNVVESYLTWAIQIRRHTPQGN